MQTSEQIANKRLKTTLANFELYCSNKSKSQSQIKQNFNITNTTMTKYRSRREIVCSKTIRKSKLANETTKVKEGQKNISESKFELKNADLIEIIKHKLSLNVKNHPQHGHFKSQSSQLKTDEYKNNENYLHLTKKTNDFSSNFYNKTLNFGRKQKKKNINLMVQNIKIQPLPRESAKYNGEIFVKLKNRPNSAMPWSYKSVPTSNFEEDFKHLKYQYHPLQKSMEMMQKQTIKVKPTTQHHTLTTHSPAEYAQKDISAWEISNYDEEPFNEEQIKQKKKSRNKRVKKSLKRL